LGTTSANAIKKASEGFSFIKVKQIPDNIKDKRIAG